MQDFRWLKELWQGKKFLGPVVEKTAAAPATGTLFTVAGGRVLITSIIGEIMAAMDANATSIKLQAIPTLGSTNDLCAATNIASYAQGDELGITGVPTDNLQPDTVSSSSIPGQSVMVVVKPGTITLNLAAPGQLTGTIRWTLHYIPLDLAASVS